MRASEGAGFSEVDQPQQESQQSRPGRFKARRSGRYFIIGLIACGVIFFVVLSIVTGALRIGPFTIFLKPVPSVQQRPKLSNVASLPTDASGNGTIQGIPTGEATTDNNKGSFVLVLDPVPAGLPARTTVNVHFGYSTRVYYGTRLVGDPLTGINAMPGPSDADPTDAAAVLVHFHIKNGEIFADRLDLSNTFPPNFKL